MIHVLNGDSMLSAFAADGIPGTPVVYADSLMDGPVPASLSDDEMVAVRERWHGADVDPRLRQWPNHFSGDAGPGEVVLWFEHDLFDQLLLIRHLDWFSRHDIGAMQLSMICIDEFPGVEPFFGLGQLSVSQLASLLPSRRPISPEQLALGQRAWASFTSADPRAVERLLESDTRSLPFLAPALRRWLEEFPAVTTGVSRLERELLESVAGGTHRHSQLFRAVARQERYLSVTDTMFAGCLERLRSTAEPLVAVAATSSQDADASGGDAWPAGGDVSITQAGRDVLGGRRDWMTMYAIDSWRGGTRLTRESLWRWDSAAGRLAGPAALHGVDTQR